MAHQHNGNCGDLHKLTPDPTSDPWEVLAVHKPDDQVPACGYCWEPWPCPSYAALTTLREQMETQEQEIKDLEWANDNIRTEFARVCDERDATRAQAERYEAANESLMSEVSKLSKLVADLRADKAGTSHGYPFHPEHGGTFSTAKDNEATLRDMHARWRSVSRMYAEAQAERNRLREALTTIATTSKPVGAAYDIARTALNWHRYDNPRASVGEADIDPTTQGEPAKAPEWNKALLEDTPKGRQNSGIPGDEYRCPQGCIDGMQYGPTHEAPCTWPGHQETDETAEELLDAFNNSRKVKVIVEKDNEPTD